MKKIITGIYSLLFFINVNNCIAQTYSAEWSSLGKRSCKLLIEDRYSVSIICFQSGFNNFSNFNRYFKIITGKSPLEYRKLFAKTN